MTTMAMTMRPLTYVVIAIVVVAVVSSLVPIRPLTYVVIATSRHDHWRHRRVQWLAPMAFDFGWFCFEGIDDD